MSYHIKKTKLYFSFVSAICLILIVLSINFFEEIKTSSVIPTLKYLKFKSELLSSSKKNNLNDGPKSLPILLYHGIVEKTDRFNMTKETFKNQMFALKEQGYQTVTLQDFEDFRNGTKSLPAKSFLLTFDDGRLDSYTEADPLLRALGYTAVMYVATDASLPPEDRKKSTYYVSSEDISKMIKSGRWEIGSHAIQDTGGIIKISSDGSKGNFLSNKMWIEPESKIGRAHV